METVRPNSEPVTLTLTVADRSGLPSLGGWIDIQLMAPDRGRFLTTDFPLVEGSRLLEMRLPIEKGRASWQYVFPIRGVYRVLVEFNDEEGGRTEKNFQVRVRESRWKYVYLGLFSTVLFLTGVIAGRLFTGPDYRFGRRGIFVLAAVAVLFSVATSLNGANAQVSKSRIGQVALGVAPATVGRPSEIRWSLNGLGIGESQSARLTLTVVHREKERTVFGVNRLPVAGEFSVAFHFTDGSEYGIKTVAELETGELVENEQIVAVTPVEPPARSSVPAIMLALLVVGAGLVVGRWSRTRSLADDR